MKKKKILEKSGKFESEQVGTMSKTGSYMFHGPSDQTLVHWCLLPLKTDYLGFILVTGDLNGLSDKYGPFTL